MEEHLKAMEMDWHTRAGRGGQGGAQLATKFATSLAFYRSLSLENSEKKSEKRLPGPRPRGRKNSKNVDKELKTSRQPEKNLKKLSFSTLFRVFLTRAERLREPLFRLFTEFSGRGLFDSCRRPTMSQNQIVTSTSETFSQSEQELATNNARSTDQWKIPRTNLEQGQWKVMQPMSWRSQFVTPARK